MVGPGLGKLAIGRAARRSSRAPSAPGPGGRHPLPTLAAHSAGAAAAKAWSLRGQGRSRQPSGASCSGRPGLRGRGACDRLLVCCAGKRRAAARGRGMTRGPHTTARLPRPFLPEKPSAWKVTGAQGQSCARGQGLEGVGEIARIPGPDAGRSQRGPRSGPESSRRSSPVGGPARTQAPEQSPRGPGPSGRGPRGQGSPSRRGPLPHPDPRAPVRDWRTLRRAPGHFQGKLPAARAAIPSPPAVPLLWPQNPRGRCERDQPVCAAGGGQRWETGWSPQRRRWDA